MAVLSVMANDTATISNDSIISSCEVTVLSTNDTVTIVNDSIVRGGEVSALSTSNAAIIVNDSIINGGEFARKRQTFIEEWKRSKIVSYIMRDTDGCTKKRRNSDKLANCVL